MSFCSPLILSVRLLEAIPIFVIAIAERRSIRSCSASVSPCPSRPHFLRIIFPHIPKCAGTSVKEQFSNRTDVFLDYFCHPTWIHVADTVAGKALQAELKSQLPERSDWIVFGHFEASAYDDIDYDFKVLLLRDPLERAVSHFHYIKQSLPDNDVTRRRHREVGLIKDDQMSFEEFADLDHIRHFYGKFYLRNLDINQRLILLAVSDLDSSFYRLYLKTGLKLNTAVHSNRSIYSKDFGHLRSCFAEDVQLYQYLIAHQDDA